MRNPRRMTAGQGRERGSQLLEFAIAAPMLLLLVIGVWDYGAAFALKQKLTNAAREGARIVSETPSSTADVGGTPCTPAPCNIQAGMRAVVQYVDHAGLNASCLLSAAPTSAAPSNGWIYSCNKITLEIDRGIVSGSFVEPYIAVPQPGIGTVNVGMTVVTLIYPVTWTAGQLVPPPLPPQITSQVKMQNIYP